MKALILNSGLGSRMGVLTSEHPKCMTEISHNETILSRQLNLILKAGSTQVVMTTGYYDDVLENYCRSLDLPLNYTFVRNPVYASTNYIYSIYCARDYLDERAAFIFQRILARAAVYRDTIARTVNEIIICARHD